MGEEGGGKVLDDESQTRVMASIQEEVARGSVGFRLDGIAVDDVTLADDDST